MSSIIMYSNDMPADNLTTMTPFVDSLYDIFSKKYPDAAKIIMRLIADYYIGYVEDDDGTTGATYLWRMSDAYKDVQISTTEMSRGYVVGGLSLLQFNDNSSTCDFFPPQPFFFELYQQYPDVLFGEHLTNKNPGKPVKVVANEVDAIIKSGMHPEYNWLAVGYGRELSAGMINKIHARHWDLQQTD